MNPVRDVLAAFAGFLVGLVVTGLAGGWFASVTIFTLWKGPELAQSALFVALTTAALAGAVVLIVRRSRQGHGAGFLEGLLFGVVLALLVGETCGVGALHDALRR